MSVMVTVDVTDDAILTYGGKPVRPAAHLRIEVDASDPRAGHAAIAAIAERAHDQLRQAIEDMRESEAKADETVEREGLTQRAAAAAARITTPRIGDSVRKAQDEARRRGDNLRNSD